MALLLPLKLSTLTQGLSMVGFALYRFSWTVRNRKGARIIRTIATIAIGARI